MLITYKNNNRKHMVVGRGLCTCKKRHYIKGKGFADIINAIVSNIGTVTDVAKGAYDTGKIIYDTVGIARDIKNMDKNEVDENKIINEVKANSVLTILEQLRKYDKKREKDLIMTNFILVKYLFIKWCRLLMNV